MGSRSDVDDDDDDFNDLYKAYTGPIASKPSKTEEIITSVKKRSLAGSDEEEDDKDPNAVPTDFTSREAKVWEAKSKAIERNWKKRKEEEMTCKLCGESGHFTQGCPTTLGANRKSQNFIERVPAREPHVKALFTEQVVNQLEKDIGCKIKIEEKFIIVSGKDRLILKKGVDSVHNIKKDGEVKGASGSKLSRSRSPAQRSPVGSRLGRSVSLRSDSDHNISSHFHGRSTRHEKNSELKGGSSSQPPRSRSPAQRSPVGSRLGRPVSLRSDPDPHTSSQFHSGSSRHEKDVENRVREDLLKLTRGSPQAYDGARGSSSYLRSPPRVTFPSNTDNLYDRHSQGTGDYRMNDWDADRHGAKIPSDHAFFPNALEELAFEYQREATELGRVRDKEEEEENYRHREAVREIRENHVKKLNMVRGIHARQWDEFLQLDAQKRQQQQQQQQARYDTTISGFSGYRKADYPESVSNSPMDPQGWYPPNPGERYPSSGPHDHYAADIEHQRRGDYGKAYNRF